MSDKDPETENEKQPVSIENHPFKELGLSDDVVKAVIKSGYETPSDIQTQAIPAVLEGRDVIGSSQTGTGKTAAFALPVISKLGQHKKKLRCLVLEPTRELAEQVTNSFQKYSGDTGLKTVLIQGGVGYGRQKELLAKGCDVVVATPGRLIDHHKQGTINFKDIEILILDEVDRMLDMGFLPDVRRIVQFTPNSRQTLFFSATVPSAIEGLAKWALKNPFSVEVGQRCATAETISHCLYPVRRDQKIDILKRLLTDVDFKSVLIFTETKLDAEIVARKLEAEDHKVLTLHSDRSQKERREALEGFKSGKFSIMVATDVAGRGLDISGITHVINYDVPRNPENYVHRIGRTGRANTEGDAFTIFAADEIENVKAIEDYIEKKIERKKLDNFNYKFTMLLEEKVPDKPVRRGRNRGYVPANTFPINIGKRTR